MAPPPRLGGGVTGRHPKQQQQHDPQPSAKKRAVAEDAAAPKPAYPPPPPRPPTAADGGADADGAAYPPPPPPPPTFEEEKSSRLCIKGLPAYVTEQRLRDHLRAASRKEVATAAAGMTDLKLLRTRDAGGGGGMGGGSAANAAGASRRMAFVGFRSEADADAVRRYFDRTFLDASRLAVEVSMKTLAVTPSLVRPPVSRRLLLTPLASPPPSFLPSPPPPTLSSPASTATTPYRAPGPATRRGPAGTPS
jgi:hypothetical protein